MNRARRKALAGAGLAIALVGVASIGFVGRSSSDDAPSSVGKPGSAAGQIAAAPTLTGVGLDALITTLQDRLDETPEDYVAWATLGLAYVQQAKVTVNPDFYPKADGVLAKSLALNDEDNFLAYAGLSALASARHDFAAGKSHAERGLEINSYSAILLGALSDAEIQLGNYTEAFSAVQKMVDLSPDTASLSRASYTWELRGDLPKATSLMQRALDDAPTPEDKAFALYHLGELAFNAGDADAALEYFNLARAQSPTSPAALAGKAKAEAAVGQTQTALDHYAELVGRAPEPSYILEYGELLESLGRTAEAQQQYDVFAATQQLFSSNGVAPDATVTLFHANHGDQSLALADAEAAIQSRPFLDMYDAYAWALHLAGRHEEALAAVQTAMELGFRSALFHYHAGMISLALGDADGAESHLTEALDINPYFNPLAAPAARKALDALTGPGK